MDIGASSYLNSSINSLRNIFNKCMYPFAYVGDSKSVSVSNTCHSILPASHKPLRLSYVHITPNNVKNLISAHQFVRDNKCIVEFDEFGFSTKDYLTYRVFLRCDSAGDLYLIMKYSPIPQVFLASQHTWNQRLITFVSLANT